MNTTLEMDPLTLLHVAITLIAIASGLVVLSQMLSGAKSAFWTALFLIFTGLTSITGYLFFHPKPVTPAQTVGAVALVILAVALYALYGSRLRGAWRPIYVVTAVMSLYLNVFVLVVQLFLKVPALHALAPTGAGPVFGGVQGVVLLAFVVVGWLGVKRFHPVFLG